MQNTQAQQFDFESARRTMTETQVRPSEVFSQRVLDTIDTISREAFVPERYRRLAYADVAIPLDHGQVMFTPKVEGRILQAMEPGLEETVLEIGTGTGYLAACFARMAQSITSVDIYGDFTARARDNLKGAGVDNVELITANAVHGLDTGQRYDVVVVEAALARIGDDFRRHVREGGRLFLIVGEPPIMEAWLFTHLGEKAWSSESLFDTCVPALLGPERREFVF
jgi:protein-L-isoaspartate(D-aspartate) O-methyltransferase